MWRAIERELPEAAAWAVLEFLHGPLLENPGRVGGALGGEWEGYWDARVGPYRVIYRVEGPGEWAPLGEEPRGRVIVVRVRHRRDAYRGGPG